MPAVVSQFKVSLLALLISLHSPQVVLSLDWGLERKWPAVSAMEMELESDQAKKVGQVMLPNYLEEVEAFFFSQWVVFGSLMMCLCPILRSRGRVDIGQASLTSKAQVSLEMLRWINENAWIPQMGMMNMSKFQSKWKVFMVNAKFESWSSRVWAQGIWGASVANQDSPFSFWIFIELAPSNMINC